jgi:hypothetical protein
VAAVRLSSDNIFLPIDDEDIEDFIDSDSMDQLLNKGDLAFTNNLALTYRII